MPLPDCMMPDGAEPCLGYRQMREAIEVGLKFVERIGSDGYGGTAEYEIALDALRRAFRS